METPRGFLRENRLPRGNAILLSTWKDATIELPMDSKEYERILLEKGEKSTFQKTKVAASATSGWRNRRARA